MPKPGVRMKKQKHSGTPETKMCHHQQQESHLIQQLSLSPAIRKLRRVPTDCPSFPSAIRFCIKYFTLQKFHLLQQSNVLLGIW